jgi:hypothetical protein
MPAVEPQMLREAIPEKDWTPRQREQMRGWKRLWTRDRQWERIDEWKIRQEHECHYICLADIADWCARALGGIERDPALRMQAYFDLQQSILRGEFSKGDRLKVLYLGPEQPPLREAMRLRLNTGYLRAHRGRVLDRVLDLRKLKGKAPESKAGDPSDKG